MPSDAVYDRFRKPHDKPEVHTINGMANSGVSRARRFRLPPCVVTCTEFISLTDIVAQGRRKQDVTINAEWAIEGFQSIGERQGHSSDSSIVAGLTPEAQGCCTGD